MSEKNIIIYEERKIDLSDKIRRIKESLICVIWFVCFFFIF